MSVLLAPHFSLAELTVTSTGTPNVPTPEDVDRLRRLCLEVLEPVRAETGPLRVTSGFRSAAVNAELRARGYSAATTSAHMCTGSPIAGAAAADVVPLSCTLDYAWSCVRRLVGLGVAPIDQAIVYQRQRDHGWIHLGMADRPRRQVLVQLADGRTYVPWASFGGVIYTP